MNEIDRLPDTQRRLVEKVTQLDIDGLWIGLIQL